MLCHSMRRNCRAAQKAYEQWCRQQTRLPADRVEHAAQAAHGGNGNAINVQTWHLLPKLRPDPNALHKARLAEVGRALQLVGQALVLAAREVVVLQQRSSAQHSARTSRNDISCRPFRHFLTQASLPLRLVSSRVGLETT